MNSAQFKKRLDQDFKYLVTPLVFDLRMKLQSDAFEIEAVYGSPEEAIATGELMHVNTLFPSPLDNEGRTKGGVILLKLKPKPNVSLKDAKLSLNVRYVEYSTHNFIGVISQ
jgi:Ca-activated chloride channel family protein